VNGAQKSHSNFLCDAQKSHSNFLTVMPKSRTVILM
jgi:hypothetical protein